FGGNFAAGNGDNTNLAAIANLGDTATINLDTGLRFWAGTDAQFAVAVPEPSSIALLGLASLFAMRRQRR
ncbi:MAG: PEP-CTERM sorting domain-containing protein, partial [Akkermansiaceae bacterium]|nr:PEP-CTERM sorting domain-containing protein [Akkermansiaceae bacterium]